MTEETRIVEISGIKLEVDTRQARVVEQYRVGDPVKVLVKKWGDHHDSHHGVIVGFDNFQKLPTINVCYLDGDELKIVSLNSENEDAEIAPVNDSIIIERDDVLAKMDAKIVRAEQELEDLKRKRAYFVSRFGVLFGGLKDEEA